MELIHAPNIMILINNVGSKQALAYSHGENSHGYFHAGLDLCDCQPAIRVMMQAHHQYQDEWDGYDKLSPYG